MRPLRAGGPTAALGPSDMEAFLARLLEEAAKAYGRPRRVLLVPPDHTRLHSRAGDLTRILHRLLSGLEVAILPATGTHRTMGGPELSAMFGDLDAGLFLGHDHRRGVARAGEIEEDYLGALSGGRLRRPFPVDLDRRLLEGGDDLIISLGQVVPHEVVGMANYTKNLIVGLGGAESIDLSHWLGALAGLEGLMGRAESPVRSLLDEAARRFLAHLPIVYVHTVVAEGALRGLFAGPGPQARPGPEDGACYQEAAALSAALNVATLPEGIDTCLVNLDPREYRSTWLGNKAVYRTRMALRDGADLVVLGPGLDRFGEDPAVDALIRRHGYRGTPATLAAVASDPDLAANLSAAAHLVHGSSEGRFRITYCTESLTRAEVEGVGFSWMDPREARERFRPEGLAEGWNEGPQGPLFYVSNPALGLWKRART